MRTLSLLILCLTICVLVQSAVAENNQTHLTFKFYDSYSHAQIGNVTSVWIVNDTQQNWQIGNISTVSFYGTGCNLTLYAKSECYYGSEYEFNASEQNLSDSAYLTRMTDCTRSDDPQQYTDPYDFGDYPHAVQLTFIDKDTREPVQNESGKLLTHVYCDDFIKSLTGIDCQEMYIDEAFLTDENGQTTKYLMSSFETWVSIRNVSVGFHPIQDAYIINLF